MYNFIFRVWRSRSRRLIYSVCSNVSSKPSLPYTLHNRTKLTFIRLWLILRYRDLTSKFMQISKYYLHSSRYFDYKYRISKRIERNVSNILKVNKEETPSSDGVV
jgi:hypothetical protein